MANTSATFHFNVRIGNVFNRDQAEALICSMLATAATTATSTKLGKRNAAALETLEFESAFPYVTEQFTDEQVAAAVKLLSDSLSNQWFEPKTFHKLSDILNVLESTLGGDTETEIEALPKATMDAIIKWVSEPHVTAAIKTAAAKYDDRPLTKAQLIEKALRTFNETAKELQSLGCKVEASITHPKPAAKKPAKAPAKKAAK